MRIIRVVLVLSLAVVLVLVALANRSMVTVNLFPAQFGKYLGGQWSLTMPLFLVVFLGIALGLVIGLVWEYLREARLRSESNRRAHRVASLENEVGHLRQTHAAPRDEVLAILDAPEPRRAPSKAGAAALPSSPAAPAPQGAALPAPSR